MRLLHRLLALPLLPLMSARLDAAPAARAPATLDLAGEGRVRRDR